MKVIVNVSGFYGGTWHDAGKEPQVMADAVARQFLPPYGDQLARAKADKPAAVAAPSASTAKPDDKKAG